MFFSLSAPGDSELCLFPFSLSLDNIFIYIPYDSLAC